jgi:hypothetical protein
MQTAVDQLFTYVKMQIFICELTIIPGTQALTVHAGLIFAAPLPGGTGHGPPPSSACAPVKPQPFHVYCQATAWGPSVHFRLATGLERCIARKPIFDFSAVKVQFLLLARTVEVHAAIVYVGYSRRNAFLRSCIFPLGLRFASTGVNVMPHRAGYRPSCQHCFCRFCCFSATSSESDRRTEARRGLLLVKQHADLT